MTESELIKLFVVINKCYGYFAYNDEIQIQLWLKMLKDVPFAQADANLERYLLNPENKRPPHPGILAENASQSSISNYVPNAQETLIMLERRDKQLLGDGSSAIPEKSRERMRQLGYKPSARS